MPSLNRLVLSLCCGAACLVGSASTSEACCLFPWMWGCGYRPSTCCYQPPTCCPPPCAPACAPACGPCGANYGWSGCSSCGGSGCSSCGGGSSCGPGGCGVTSVAPGAMNTAGFFGAQPLMTYQPAPAYTPSYAPAYTPAAPAYTPAYTARTAPPVRTVVPVSARTAPVRAPATVVNADWVTIGR